MEECSDSEKLKILEHLAKENRIDSEDFEQSLYYLVEKSSDAEVLIRASNLYADVLNNFDYALKIAEKADGIGKTIETQCNYLDKERKKHFVDSWY
jgi:hypothetical protein